MNHTVGEKCTERRNPFFQPAESRSANAGVYLIMKLMIVKMTAMAASCLVLAYSLLGRYHPVSLERSVPDIIEAEIKGEVSHPGVYSLKNGASLQDLIKAAGGETENADTDDQILMEPVKDGQIFVIGAKAGNGEWEKISISTADLERLQQLPGIGPAMAQRIIDYRTEHPFQSLEELMEVKGIGEKTFEKLKDRIEM